MKNVKKLRLIFEIHCVVFRVVRRAMHEFCTWDWQCLFNKCSWSSMQMNKTQTAKEKVLLHILLKKGVLLSSTSQGPCAEVFAFVYTALEVKWNLLV